MVAPGAAVLVELVDRLGEQVEGSGVVEGAGDEAETLGQVAPHVLAEGGARVLLDGVVDDLPEVLGRPVAAREADEREARRQQSPVREVVDRGHELLAGEVTRHAEEDETARTGDAREALVLSGAERVLAVGDSRRGHPRPPRESAVVTWASPASWSVR